MSPVKLNLLYKIKQSEELKIMKIALPSRENKIDGHFGHCEYFTVFTVNENKEITSQDTVQPPAGCGCKSNIAQTLAQMGVKVMLAGNMGQGAVNVLSNHGIEVLRGCAGDVREVAEQWLEGALTDSGLGCQIHDHEGCHHN
jgi:predicted Fe-Mo cluster-binding NifX family protein